MSARSDLAGFARKRLDRFEANLAESLATGEVEAVHQVRVSSRKLVEPIRLIGTFVGERAPRRVIKELRRFRNRFRDVRDLDVLQLSFTQAGNEPNLNPTDLAQLEGCLTSHRQRALNKARGKCKSREIAKLISSIGKLIDTFEARADKDDRRILDDARAQWRERADELIAETDPAKSRQNLHPMRICLKRFRYSTELMLRLEGREDDSILRELADLQDELGAWNDCVFAAREVARLAGDPDTLAGQPRWSGHLFAYAGERCLQMEARHDSIVARLPEVNAFLKRVCEGQATDAAPRRLSLENSAV